MLIKTFILLIALMGIMLIKVKNKKLFSFIISFIGICMAISLPVVYAITNDYIDYLSFFYFEDITFVFITTFSLVFALGVLFTILHKKINYIELGFIFLYFICAIGLVISKNIITVFAFWEGLAMVATAIILTSNHTQSKAVALKYFTIHALSGVLFMIGVVGYLYYNNTDYLSVTLLDKTHGFNYFILIAILINLGLPPLASWIVDGYSKCSPIASMFLSIFTTKIALFLLLTLFYGNMILIYMGIIISCYGIFFSLFEMNLRKLLALSIIQQLGIIIIAVATTNLEFDTFIVSYIVVNILYKLLFFMIAVILYNRFASDDLNMLKGTINVKSIMGIFLILNTLQALGLPFTGNFIAKTYLFNNVEAIEFSWLAYTLTFLLAASSLNVGMKIAYYLLNKKNTAKAITLYNNYKLIPFFVICIVAELIFLFNGTEFLSLKNIVHSLEILVAGLLIFFIGHKLFKNKTANIITLFENFRLRVLAYSNYCLKVISNINCNNFIMSTYETVNTKLGSINHYNKFYSSSLVLVSLFMFIIIYVLVRLF